jgi:hypothetical protein
MRKVGVAPFTCPKCGSHEGFCGARQGFLERFVLPIMMIQPVRCTACDERSHRFPFSLGDALSDALMTDPGQPAAALSRQ